MNLIQKLVLIASATLPLHAQQCDAMQRFGQSLPLWKQILQADAMPAESKVAAADTHSRPLGMVVRTFVEDLDLALRSESGRMCGVPLRLFGLHVSSVRDLGDMASEGIAAVREIDPLAWIRGIADEMASECKVEDILAVETGCGCRS